MSRETAIAKVNEFAAGSGIGAWPQINRANLAAGLIERINNPNLINQQGTPMCGPASMTRAIASDNPDAYAQAAIDLYNQGAARLGSMALRPGRELIQAAPGGGANAADWIMLATIRDSNNWFLSPAGWFGSNAAGMTIPSSMEGWFRSAGYKDIVNITYLALKPIPSVLAMEAARASRLFSAGYKVVMFIDSDMLKPDDQDDLVSMYPDHWVALNSTITDRGIINYDGPVSFHVYTWGRDLPVPVDPNKPLSKGDFLHRYYGFIAGRF